MPTIYKRPKAQRQLSDKRLLRRKLYNNAQWRKLRNGYLMSQPICEICGKALAEEVHHVQSPFEDGLDDLTRLYRLTNPENLQALCKDCHSHLHGNETRQKLLEGKHP